MSTLYSLRTDELPASLAPIDESALCVRAYDACPLHVKAQVVACMAQEWQPDRDACEEQIVHQYRDGSTLWVLSRQAVQARIIGFIGIAHGYLSTPQISSMYVVPHERRRGFTKPLISHAVLQARRLGIPILLGFAPPEYEEYYKEFGFKKEASRLDTLMCIARAYMQSVCKITSSKS